LRRIIEQAQFLEIFLIHAAHGNAGGTATTRRQHLPLDEIDRKADAIHLFDCCHGLLVVRELTFDGEAGEMSVEPQDLVEQLASKPVHYRHDDDKRRHANGDTYHGQAGNDRDEGFLAPRAQIAPGNHPLKPGKRAGGPAYRGYRRNVGQMSVIRWGSMRPLRRAITPLTGSVSRSPVLRCLISTSPDLRPRGPTIS